MKHWYNRLRKNVFQIEMGMNMKKLEKLKEKLKKLSKKQTILSPDDPNTIQARRDGEGNMGVYYILTPGLQNGIAYYAV